MYLLHAPQVLELQTFTTMPGIFRRQERSAWADANRGGQPTDSFLEGPVFDDAGNGALRACPGWDQQGDPCVELP